MYASVCQKWPELTFFRVVLFLVNVFHVTMSKDYLYGLIEDDFVSADLTLITWCYHIQEVALSQLIAVCVFQI